MHSGNCCANLNPSRPLSEYRDNSSDRKATMAAAYATADYTMQEIATCFGVHYTTVSRTVRHAEHDKMYDCMLRRWCGAMTSMPGIFTIGKQPRLISWLHMRRWRIS